jgi:hypothetical protein|tara:strand:+ start:1293 stop:1493 length:201 start_codon:yes stop_codon:yes gene_type:complete
MREGKIEANVLRKVLKIDDIDSRFIHQFFEVRKTMIGHPQRLILKEINMAMQFMVSEEVNLTNKGL